MIPDTPGYNQGKMPRKVLTQIGLDQIQYKILKRVSEERLISLSHLIRFAVHNFLVEIKELGAPKFRWRK